MTIEGLVDALSTNPTFIEARAKKLGLTIDQAQMLQSQQASQGAPDFHVAGSSSSQYGLDGDDAVLGNGSLSHSVSFHRCGSIGCGGDDRLRLTVFVGCSYCRAARIRSSSAQSGSPAT